MHLRQTGTASLALATLLLLAGCGSGSSAPASGAGSPSPATSPTAGDASGADALVDLLEDPGDDRLGEQAQPVQPEGVAGSLAWQVPEGYALSFGQSMTEEVDDDVYEIQVVARPDVTPADLAARVTDDTDPGESAEVLDGRLRDTDVVVAALDTDALSSLSVLWAPPGTSVTIGVVAYVPEPTDELAAERLEDLAQVAGSLRYTPGPGDAPGSAGASTGTAAPEDDLLDDVRVGVELRGVDRSISWRFPEAYERNGARQARLSADGVDYEITVGAEPGTTQQQAGERLVEQDGGLGAEVEDVEVAGRSFTRAGFSTPRRSLQGWFVTPRGSTSTVAVLLTASTSLDDVPPERLAELEQLLASLELGPRRGPGS